MVRSVTLNGRPSPLSSALPGRGGVLHWTGPLAQHIHWYGPRSVTPTITIRVTKNNDDDGDIYYVFFFKL